MRRFVDAVAVLVGASLLLSGCAQSPRSDPTLPAPDGSSQSPIGLVGLWRVTGAKGQKDHTWLRITGDEVTLWDKCGVLSGEIVTGDHRLLFGFSGGIGGSPCGYDDGPPAPGWILDASGFRADLTASGAAWILTDAAGAAVAHLAVDGHPPKSRNYSDQYTTTPVQTARDRSGFAEPVPLPDGVTAVDDLTGRWVPLLKTPKAPTQPFVRFDRSGEWSGTDGCNGAGGRWISGPGGLLLATSGASTDVGCEGSDLQYALAVAARVGVAHGVLTFFGRDGKQLAQAVRPGHQR